MFRENFVEHSSTEIRQWNDLAHSIGKSIRNLKSVGKICGFGFIYQDFVPGSTKAFRVSVIDPNVEFSQ